jgi:hypothetical protein
MAAPEDTLISGNKTLIPTIASLLIPGSGQALLGRRWKGLVILLTTAVLTFLVNWALVNLNIGQVSIDQLVMDTPHPILGMECSRCPKKF